MAARQPQPDSGTTDVTHLSTQDEASMDAPPLHLESTAAAMSEAPSSDDGRDCRPDDHTTRTGEGATTADNQTGLSRSTEPFQVGLWRLEAAEERRRNHQQPSGDGGADDSTVAAVPTSPMNFSGTFREEPMHANMDSTTTLVTVYHKRGVSHVEVDASDFATGEKLKAFIRYKERKYDAVNRLNRICTFLVMFLFLNCMCRAIGLANESWFSMYFPLSGRREGYGVFRSCVNTVDIDTCHSWTTFPRALIEATCTVPHLHARIRTLWAFAIMDACAVGVASILALLTAFRPTRSKFHMAILILCFVSVPFGIITLALFRNLIGCVRGQCPARGCEDGFGWGFTVYIVAVCASFIGASLASSMRSYVFVLRRTAKRELQLERRLQRVNRRRGAVQETDDVDDNVDDNIGDDVELLRSDRVVAAGAATAGDSAGNSENEDAQPDSASMPPRRNQQECNAPFGDGDSCTETPNAGRRASGEEGPLLCSPHHPTKRRESTVRLVSGGGEHHVVSSSEGGGGRKQQQHVRAFSGNDDGTIGAVLSPQNASYRSSSVHHMTGSSGPGPSARRGHSRQVSGASVGSNLSFGGFQFGAPASSASKHHMRGHSNGGDFASSTSFYSSGGGAPPPPQYISALEMGVEIDGADDWVYAEDGDMYYSFHLHMFWDPINHEYYNCTLKRWQESLEL